MVPGPRREPSRRRSGRPFSGVVSQFLHVSSWPSKRALRWRSTHMAVATRPTEKTRFFKASPRALLINGKFEQAESGKTFETLNPATDTVLASIAEGDAHDIDRAVRAARRAFENGPWSRMTPSERGQIMHRIGDLIMEHADELAELDCLDNGKALGVARAADVPLAADLFWYMAGWATKLNGGTINPSVPYLPGAEFHAYTLREPVGVVGQIIPWNFPLLMAAWKLGPALATGCTVVLKPAEQTPLSALRLGELMLEAGLPEGVVNIVTGFGETAGAALAAHDDVDKVSFTGSTEVGRLIVRAAAGNLKKLTLELGGKSPLLIFDDADLEMAIPNAAMSIFGNSGQVCSAASRLIVHRSIYDRVVEGIDAVGRKLRLGYYSDAGADLGPLISAKQYARVWTYVQHGIAAGAEGVGGPAAEVPGGGYFFSPTVL